MIYEFALEPELVATWHNIKLGKLLLESFGLGTGRILCRFPKAWADLVRERGGELSLTDMQEKRLTEIVVQLCETTSKRDTAPYDSKLTWCTNAFNEQKRKPFRLILDRDNFETELNASDGAWEIANTVTVARNAAALVRALSPLLSSATHAIFVDPYFLPGDPVFMEPLRAYLQGAVAGRDCEPAITLELHAMGGLKLNWDQFRDGCERHLPSIIPSASKLRIRRWFQVRDQQQLHNRYLLTELGGVFLGAGFSTYRPGATDDIAILARSAFEQHWNEYVVAPPFLLEGELEVEGTA